MIKVKKISDTATIPTKALPNDAAWDLFANRITVQDGCLVYHLGVAVTPPEGYFIAIVPRSSISKTRYMFANSFGVVDPNYTGELQFRVAVKGSKVIDKSHEDDDFMHIESLEKNCLVEKPFNIGDRVAQMFLLPIVQSEIVVVDELDNTDRGANGFGSTGK